MNLDKMNENQTQKNLGGRKRGEGGNNNMEEFDRNKIILPNQRQKCKEKKEVQPI